MSFKEFQGKTQNRSYLKKVLEQDLSPFFLSDSRIEQQEYMKYNVVKGTGNKPIENGLQARNGFCSKRECYDHSCSKYKCLDPSYE